MKRAHKLLQIVINNDTDEKKKKTIRPSLEPPTPLIGLQKGVKDQRNELNKKFNDMDFLNTIQRNEDSDGSSSDKETHFINIVSADIHDKPTETNSSVSNNSSVKESSRDRPILNQIQNLTNSVTNQIDNFDENLNDMDFLGTFQRKNNSYYPEEESQIKKIMPVDINDNRINKASQDVSNLRQINNLENCPSILQDQIVSSQNSPSGYYTLRTICDQTQNLYSVPAISEVQDQPAQKNNCSPKLSCDLSTQDSLLVSPIIQNQFTDLSTIQMPDTANDTNNASKNLEHNDLHNMSLATDENSVSILQNQIVSSQISTNGYTLDPIFCDQTKIVYSVPAIIEVQEQLASYDITTRDSLLPSPVIQNEITDLSTTQIPDPANDANNASINVENNDLHNMSIATDDIVLDSPASSFSIPSVVSSPQSGISSPGSTQSRKRSSEKRKVPGKIRTRNMKEWKDLKRKAMKNSGKMYTSRKGKVVEEKQIKLPCNCLKKCIEKVPQAERERIFKQYWDIADHERQWDFISKHVTEETPKRIKSQGPNRSRTNTYRLPKDSSSVIVCRTMFLNTLSISEKVIRTVLRKQTMTNTEETESEGVNPFKLTDLRGRHKNRPHKIQDSVRESVKDHINSLVPIESHYCRKSTTKKYFDGHLSYPRLHVEYLTWFSEEKYGETKAKCRQYTDIVNENFNIGFHSPKKDQCDRCHAYSNISNPTEEEKQEQEKHLALKDLARNLKDSDKAAAQCDQTIVTACFDMQKVLNCPHGEVSIFYYKRRLNLQNFTVFDLARKHGFCYMWTETTGKKGANEVCSSLLLFMLSALEQDSNQFRFWSDNCSGQNRNRIVFAFYQYVIAKYAIESITHRFLEVGHTQNEGDSVHSVIEGASNKGRVLYTPEQWYNLIRWAKVVESAYRVKELTQEDILDFRSLLDGRNWTKNDVGEKVAWNKIKEISIRKNNPDIMLYKYELDSEEYSAITTSKKTRSKKAIVMFEIQKAYTSPLKLNYDKYKDLLGMCENKIIPEEFASFFKSLPHYERYNTCNNENLDEDEEQ